jgi:iron complex transport system substrate-binding protein
MVRRFMLLLGFLVAIPVSAEIRITDDLGEELVMAGPARRIISLAPNITEILFALGAGERIVGADEFSNYPEQAKAIPRVNNYHAANYELMLSLEPDVVIAWQSGNGDGIISRIRQLGLPVFIIEPRSLEDLEGIIEHLGVIAGERDAATERIADFQRQLRHLKQTYSQRQRVKVFYQIWNEPLITLNGEHLVSDVIRLCGGVNVFSDAGPLVPYVSIEAVLQANPEVIVASGSNNDSPAWLQMWQAWPALKAVQDGHIYSIPPDLMQRHSLRIIEGAAMLCRYLDGAR